MKDLPSINGMKNEFLMLSVSIKSRTLYNDYNRDRTKDEKAIYLNAAGVHGNNESFVITLQTTIL